MDVDEAEETVTVEDLEYVYFMRYLMIMRLVEKEELINVYKTIFQHDSRAEQFDDAVEKVNDFLKMAKLEVKEVICEVLMRPFYVVYSTLYRSDKIWPSNRSEEELDFIKRVVHEIMMSGRGIVSSMRCLNLDVKLSKSDRENLIKTLVSDKWFIESKKGSVTMSALCTTELQPYLRENYREVMTKCAFCKRNVYFGDICSECNAIGHRLCVKKYKQSMKKAFKCPSCSKEWLQSQSSSQVEDMDYDETE